MLIYLQSDCLPSLNISPETAKVSCVIVAVQRSYIIL